MVTTEKYISDADLEKNLETILDGDGVKNIDSKCVTCGVFVSDIVFQCFQCIRKYLSS